MFSEVAHWVFSTGGFIFMFAILAAGAIQSLREKRLPTWFVFTIAITSMFWAETFGDWSAYLLYDPTLPQMPIGHIPFTAPSKPWGILPGYTWFNLLWALATLPILRFVMHRRPTWNAYLTAVLIAAPLYVLFEIGVEYTMCAAGVWSYTQHFGPALHSARGTFPLMWPLYPQIPFMGFLTWVFYRIDQNGLTPVDRFIPSWAGSPSGRRPGTPRIDEYGAVPTDERGGVAVREVTPDTADGSSPRWRLKYEFARVAIWVLVFNFLFVATIMVPMFLVRVVFGMPSDLVP